MIVNEISTEDIVMKIGLLEMTPSISPVLTPLQTVRYMKHTCTLAKFHILASYLYRTSVKLGADF